jgi:2-polyprenyl-3-methyl-5-hydroxy-6-metoxy-1,4-benzoquinol methylase
MDKLAKKLSQFFNSLKNKTPFNTMPIVDTVCISTVKNEQDIIELFVRHNQRFFDVMIILDNNSSDLTRKILNLCAREFGNIIVTDHPDFAYNQSKFMTETLRHVQGAFFADFAFFLDADEFIGAKDMNSFLHEIRKVPIGSCGKMKWKTFMPPPAVRADHDIEPLARMNWKRKVENPEWSKAFVRLGGAIDSDLFCIQGNHDIKSRSNMSLQSIIMENIPLFHFPIRSKAQLLAKGTLGWQANIARGGKSKKEGLQWKKLHDLNLRDPNQLTDHQLSEEAMSYAQNTTHKTWKENAEEFEHKISTERRYSDGSFGDLDILIEESQTKRPMHSQSLHLPRPTNVGENSSNIAHSFSSTWHWDNFFLDAPPLNYIIEKFSPTSILDIGCGNGIYLHLAKHNGVMKIKGIDGVPHSSTVLNAEEYAVVDLEKPIHCKDKYDLVICLEVIEHVKPENTQLVFETISMQAKSRILFSMAEPGQPGNGHINCLGISEVLNLWAELGWHPQLADTLAVRSLSSLSWFKRNLILLERSVDTRYIDAAEQLSKIGRFTYRWYRQKSGPRLIAFKEPFESAKQGYLKKRLI